MCTVGSLVGCAGNDDQAVNNGTQVTFNYQVTEEGVHFKMPNAPITPAWKPNELLEANLDEVALYNKSSIPLKARILKDRLSPVNSTQKLDTEIVALSIMNSTPVVIYHMVRTSLRQIHFHIGNILTS